MDTYADLYSYLSKGQHTETDTKKYLENNGRSDTNARKCVALAKDAKIAQLQKKVSEGICAAILADMDKKILIPASVVSEPPEILAKDFFEDSPGADIDFIPYVSKSAEETEVDSLYERKVEPEKVLTIRNFVRRVCSQFKEGRVFKSILNLLRQGFLRSYLRLIRLFAPERIRLGPWKISG